MLFLLDLTRSAQENIQRPAYIGLSSSLAAQSPATGVAVKLFSREVPLIEGKSILVTLTRLLQEKKFTPRLRWKISVAMDKSFVYGAFRPSSLTVHLSGTA